MIASNRAAAALLVTGATGLIGHRLLARLMAGGRRCAVLLRPPLERALPSVRSLLTDVGLGPDVQHAHQRLLPVVGDLREGLPSELELPIGGILHVAAATNFNANASGEPRATNVEGTARLLRWAAERGVNEFHLVSSAYICGRVTAEVAEAFDPTPPAFHNEYEKSKWEAERLCRQWAEGRERSLTVYRPSVVVGDYDTGRSTRFSGLYLSVRATELLSRSLDGAPPARRHEVALRIPGEAGGTQNIVPVDYVADMIAAIVGRPQAHGQTYHLTHPRPPSNLQIRAALERYFDLAGGRFVGSQQPAAEEMNEQERAFWTVSRPVHHYFVDTPTFRRDHVERIERATDIACRPYDDAALWRLIDYAVRSKWGRAKSAPLAAPSCAGYFEEFLPRQVPRSRIARMAALDATVRFDIEDEPDGQWVCRFEGGRLAEVHRGPNTLHEEFGYRTTRAVFWRAISGQTSPQELFLSGEAEMYGDIEKALKMAMILREFTREHPCRPVPAAQRKGGGA